MRRPPVAYAIAAVALVAAVLLRWLLDPLLGDDLALVTLFGAVALAVWTGGYRPALLVVLLGFVACAYLFMQPRGEIGGFESSNVVGLIAYLFTCALIIAIGEAARRAQMRAAERGEVLRVTLGSIGDAVVTTDTAGRVTYLNAVAEALTGWTRQDALGQPLDAVFRIVNENTRQPVESPALRALRDGTVVGLANHTILIAKDGTERLIDDSAAPIKDESNAVSGCVLVFRDVSARREEQTAEAGRLLAARVLAAIVESSDDAIVSKSLDGIIQSWNAGAERLFGYSADEALGRHISLIIPPERLAEEDRIIASLKAGRRVDHFETERRRSDGTLIQVSLTISPVKDDDGRVIGASKIVRDITDRKRTEADLERFATLIENSPDFIGICDLQGVPFYINRAGLQMVGLDGIDEARRTQVGEFFFPEDRARILEQFFPSVLEAGHGEIEVRFRNFRTGAARWMAYKVLKLKDAEGHPVAFATVSQDVTGRKQLEDDLRKLAADLSEVDRRKNEFLATLSHELRGPLAPLSNMLEVLKRGGADAKTREPALEAMQRQLGQLVRLVDDLLDLNRITHNRIELRKSHVELASVLGQAVQASRPLAESAGQKLDVILPSAPVYLDADPVRLGQVFGNLLNNACKYTDAGGTITVTASAVGNEAVVTVADNGMGLPSDQIGGIFEMFTQIDPSQRRSQGGLGIGLTLVKRLVQMHGGTVVAHSAGPGKGSEFTVRLPLSAVRSQSAAAPDADPEAVHGLRVLVVDDNQDAAASLATLLQITGNETRIAHEGAAALTVAQQQKPDVVLLDIGLPTMTGYEVCRRIRQEPWGKQAIVIALTGWGQEDDRRKSREAGFDGHLVKPVDHRALLELLGVLIAKRPANLRTNTPPIAPTQRV